MSNNLLRLRSNQKVGADNIEEYILNYKRLCLSVCVYVRHVTSKCSDTDLNIQIPPASAVTLI